MRNVSRENTLGGVESIIPAQVVAHPPFPLPTGESVSDQSVKKITLRC